MNLKSKQSRIQIAKKEEKNADYSLPDIISTNVIGGLTKKLILNKGKQNRKP